MTAGQLAFVPGVGFRARDGLLLRAPVTAERGQWSVTIDRFAAGPEQTEVGFTLSGPLTFTEGTYCRPRALNDPVSVRASSGRTAEALPGRSWQGSWSIGATKSIKRIVALEPLIDRDGRVEVIFGGSVGDWAVPLVLEPLEKLGIAALTTDASDTHHGVTIAAQAIACGSDTIAIDLRTSFAPTAHHRFMRSLGTGRMDARMRTPGQFTLRADTGDEVAEFVTFHDAVERGCDLHEVAVFGSLPAAAIKATLTIPYVSVCEALGAPVTLPIPSDTDVELGPYRARARVEGRKAPDGRGYVEVEVALDGGGWHDDRLLLYPEFLSIGGKRGGWSPRLERSPVTVSTGDEGGTAREITIDQPVMQLRGPWTMELPLR